MFKKLLDSASKTVSDFVDDPVATTVGAVTQPVRDAVDIIDGMTEGELRERAVLRLGADVVGGMALNEIVEWYTDE